MEQGHAGVMEQGQVAIEHGHAAPSAMVYVVVAAVLTALTGLEIGVFYVSALRGVLVPLLIILSGAKFALVVMFYMHLKYDSLGYTVIFLPLLLLATLVIIVMVTLFTVYLGAV